MPGLRLLTALSHPSRIIKLLILIVILYGLAASRSHYLYERYLYNLQLPFDELPTRWPPAFFVDGSIDSDGYDRADFPAPVQYSIPPKIHFVWFKDLYPKQLDRPDHVTPIPKKGSEAPARCRDHNPDFEVTIWNQTMAQDLFEQHYSWFLPTYNSYPHPIQRVDALKYFVIWHYGGIYMDMDIACRKPMGPMLEFPGWFPKATPFGVNNDLFAARARHPALEMMIKALPKRNLNLFFPYVTIFWSTGPQFAADMLQKWWATHRSTPITVAGQLNKDLLYVLPQKFYSEEYTFFGHMPGGTWHGSDVAVILWLVDHPAVLLLLVGGMLLALTMVFRRRSLLKWIHQRSSGDGTKDPALNA